MEKFGCYFLQEKQYTQNLRRKGIRVISGFEWPLWGTFYVNYPRSLQELKDAFKHKLQVLQESIFVVCQKLRGQLWILYKMTYGELLGKESWSSHKSLCADGHDYMDEAIHFTLKLPLALSEYNPICLEQ